MGFVFVDIRTVVFPLSFPHMSFVVALVVPVRMFVVVVGIGLVLALWVSLFWLIFALESPVLFGLCVVCVSVSIVVSGFLVGSFSSSLVVFYSVWGIDFLGMAKVWACIFVVRDFLCFCLVLISTIC